jgi:glycosyltransferase involved in cell wall biosynthesis
MVMLRLPQSEGVARARNEGIRAARDSDADWIAFLDDDDIWAPTKLWLQLDAAESAAGSFVCCGAIKIDPQLRPLEAHLPPPPERLVRELIRTNAVPGGGSGVLVRTTDVQALGGFDVKLSILADWDLWIRLAQRVRVVAVNDILVANLVHAGNMVVRADTLTLRREFAYLTKKHAELRQLDEDAFDRKPLRAWTRREHRRVARLEAEEQQLAGATLSSALTYFRSAYAARHPGGALWGIVSLAGRRATAAARHLQLRLRPGLEPPAKPPWLDAYTS